MHYISLQEAGPQLAQLIQEVAGGLEVVITCNDGSAFKIIPVSSSAPRPKFGSAKGLIQMSDDFDDDLEDFQDYAP